MEGIDGIDGADGVPIEGITPKDGAVGTKGGRAGAGGG
jgi:hypothetical protein